MFFLLSRGADTERVCGAFRSRYIILQGSDVRLSLESSIRVALSLRLKFRIKQKGYQVLLAH
jgi:hypothetical protein